jgi:hypothetical protein
MNGSYILTKAKADMILGTGYFCAGLIAISLRSAPVLLMLPIGLAAVCWAGYSLLTGKGYYKGCPPGGFDRVEDPFSFWAPTIIIFSVGLFAILVSLGIISFPPRP